MWNCMLNYWNQYICNFVEKVDKQYLQYKEGGCSINNFLVYMLGIEEAQPKPLKVPLTSCYTLSM